MPTFKNSEFKGEAVFNSAKTGESFIFEEATIAGDSSFKHTQFESKTNFSLCKLKSNVVLDNIGVLLKLSFNNALLGTDETHTIKIYNVNVAGEINFSGSQFRGIFTI